ncbi:DrmB family protein [Streptomyces sp. NPDC050528]|uniref:DrmB family protein n=1 Tax=Streptomyces sp. NPDC050528 TaxID=3365623 RepID=UPI0037912A25
MKDVRRKVRRTQTITPFGVGGIIDLQGESFVAADIRSWGGHGEKVESPRLARKLGVQSFRSAPVVPPGKMEFVSKVGPVYARFPRWLFCPHCRIMTFWRSEMEQKDKQPSCRRCPGNPQLVPMRFIQVCRNGHMSDVDWRRWAHSTADSPERRQCQRKRLKFVTTPDSSGLDALEIHCLDCHSRRSLEGISQKNSLKRIGIHCSGIQPWQLGNDEQVDCDETPRVVQRGASNVYFPQVHSAIDIPTPSDPSGDDKYAQAVLGNALWPDLISADEESPMTDPYRKIIAKQCGVSTEFVEILRIRHMNDMTARPDSRGTDEDLSIDEWSAFTSVAGSSRTTGEFAVRQVDLGARSTDSKSFKLIAQRIDRVVVADRIREVRALAGFSRYEPDSHERLVPVNPVSKPQWLPAVESYGEGIFISFKEKEIQEWESRESVRLWTQKIEENMEASFQIDRLREKTGLELLPRFVMLHTLAHQFIRQLSYDSGYNAASLRERIYAKGHPKDSPNPIQAGIFVYTAAGDSEGTLGGLVRQGEPPNLLDTFVRLLESAQWCSQDPLCADSTGRSLANLNRAACHACTLLPETCCETGNTLLDRTLLIGEGNVAGFFQHVIRAALEESADSVDVS